MLSSELCPAIEGLKPCSIATSYLRPDNGFTVIPWIYSVIILSLHIPLVVVRVVRWETALWLALLMAIFSTGLIILEYQSTNFDAEKIYIWIPIVLAIDIGACMQVFILVLERDGETLPVWNKLMTWIHWRSGRGLMTAVFKAPTSDDGQPKRQGTVMSTQAPQTPQPRTVRSAFSLHTVLALSLLFFLFLFILQLLGLVFASIGLHYAMKNNMTEKWCSPAFQLGSYVFDCANNYTILPTPETGVGCIWTSGMQSRYLTATVIILIVEIILEIVDATLLIMAQKDQQIWCLPWLKVKRPWCTMFFGTGIWVAMIAIGVIRGKTEALPVNGPVVAIGGFGGGPCQATLYGNALHGAIIAWSDGAFQAWGSAYRGT